MRLQGGGARPEARAADAALAQDPDGLTVPPGDTVESPWLLMNLVQGDADAAANAMRRYLTDTRPREPRWARDTLPVGWNSWFAYGPGVSFDAMLAEAQLARDLGVEVFYVDYGWSVAQGDWTPHHDRFPGDTLPRLADEVHRLGMRFGLWVAFGVADPDSALARRHPEFIAEQPEPAGHGIDGSLALCLAKAQPWIDAELDRIVRDYRLDWLKFDQPMIAACLARDHGHPSRVRGSLYANNVAFYAIVDRLRQRWPRLFVESTYDGAGYLDFGVYARSHSAWLDDNAGNAGVPVPQVQRLAYGASTIFPPHFLTGWVARAPEGQLPMTDEDQLPPGRGLSPDDLAYQSYSTMNGAWGMSLRLTDLSEEQLDRLRGLVDTYKSFREQLVGADVYHLAPTLGASEPLGSGRPVPLRAPADDTWFVLQYVQPESGRSALLAVRNGPDSPATLRVRPQGLDPEARYVATWDDGTAAGSGTGDDLRREGLALDRPAYSGGIVWLRPRTVRGV
jgi:alpha-galactosidase